MGFLDKQKTNKSSLPTQTMLVIRVIVAGYLLYLSYDLFVTRESSSIKLWQLILILALFIVCSIYILITSLYMLIKGKYEGGKADVEEAETAEAASEVSEEK